MKDSQTTSYRMAELINVCPFPAHDQPFFIIQIKSEDGRKTKNMNITPDEFKQIEKILLGVEP